MLDAGRLELDCDAETERICGAILEQARLFNRRGAVVGLSGGIDSSTVAALCARALGPDRVCAIQMCERESDDETLDLSQLVADTLGIRVEREDITGVLDAFGCYERRDRAIASVIPGYGAGHRSKIVLPDVTQNDGYNVFSIVTEAPDGRVSKRRLTSEAYLGIVAAVNFKQRARKTLEYYWADRLNYMVAGTPNRLEYDQGFFVKNGDGAADIKPIAHLYKTQVYQMAAFLGVPREVCARPPTTDTYSLPQSQDEFFFSLPYEQMDLCLFALNKGFSAEQTAEAVGLTAKQVDRVFEDISRKRSAGRYLHANPLLVEPVPVSDE